MHHGSIRRLRLATSITAVVTAIAALAAPANADNAEVMRLSDAAEQLRADAALVAGAAASLPSCEPVAPIELRKDRGGYIFPDCGPSSVDGSPSIRVSQRPANGNIDVYRDSGYIAYAPKAGFTGTDTLKFVPYNSLGDGPEQTVTINVTDSRNSAPMCFYGEGSLYETGPDQPLQGHLDVRRGSSRTGSLYCYDHDGDSLSIEEIGGPTSGLSFSKSAHGELQHTYTPSNAQADDTTVEADVRVADGKGGVSNLKLGWLVRSPTHNTSPVCQGSGPEEYQWQRVESDETEVLYDVRCWDAEGDPVTIETVTAPTRGSVVAGDAGTVRLNAVGAAAGNGAYVYRGNDGRASDNLSEPATASYVVVTPKASPTCTAGPFAFAHGTRGEFDITCDDNDADTQDALYVYAFGSSHDSVQLAAHGDMEIWRRDASNKTHYAYTPDPGFAGDDGFLLSIEDGYDFVEAAKVVLKVASAPGSDTGTGGNTGNTGNTGNPPAGPTKEQIVAAVTAALQATGGAFLGSLPKGVIKALSAVNPSKPTLAFGTADADKLFPGKQGGTVLLRLFTGSGDLPAARLSKLASAGASTIKIGGGRQAALKVTLNKAAKKALAKKRKLKVTVAMTLVDAATGATATSKRTITIKAKKKRR